MDTSVSGEDSTTIHSPSGVLFASYKPPASSGISGIEELFKLDPSLFKHHSTLEGCRIAVIQDKDKPGEYSWTFVPLPKGKQDIQEEANGWPRPVIVLGELKAITRDEWDQYKCNAEYECTIPSGIVPIPTVSYRKTSTSTNLPESDPRFMQSPTPPHEPEWIRTPSARKSGKRFNSSHLESESPTKRRRTYVESATASEDEEIEEISSTRFEATKARLKREKERKERSHSRAQAQGTSLGSTSFSAAGSPREKFAMETDPVQTKRRQPADGEAFPSSKRARSYIEVDSKARAFHKRQAAMAAQHRRPPTYTRTIRREKDFWQDVDFDQLKGKTFSLAEDDKEATPDIKPGPTAQSTSQTTEESQPIFVEDSETEDDAFGTTEEESDEPKHSDPNRKGKRHAMDEEEDEESRQKRLEESKRKLEELDAHDYQRRLHKQRLDEARRKEQARREEERIRKEREQRREGEARERFERERQQQRQRPYANIYDDWGAHYRTRAPWSEEKSYTSRSGTSYSWFNPYSTGPLPRAAPSPQKHIPTKPRWTTQQALDRYNQLSEAFDNYKGTSTAPLPAISEIPWPVLLPPGFALNQVDWTAVEEFFKAAEGLMGGQSYGRAKWKEFLKNSSRRFHPDRWRARGIIGERGYGNEVEEKVNAVAKVLNPLYAALN